MLLLHNTPEYANALKNAYRQFPAKDSTLDIDFIHNRQRVAGIYGAALDGVTFTRSTTGTYFGADSLLKTAAINEPRFEYDPVSLRSLGLLIEESRANLVAYSADFRNTASAGSSRPWSNDSGTVVTPNSIIAPDGTLTGQLITSTAEVGVRQSQAITNQTVTASLYVKAGSAPLLRLRDDNNETSVVFSPATGVISSQSNVSAASCLPVGNGWFRVTATYTTTTASWALNIRPTSTGTFYAWGAQLEAGGFATSYIPTTAATATRGADVVSMTGANFTNWYNAAEGTFLSIGSYIDINELALRFWCVDGGSSANNIRITGGSFQVIDAAGATQCNIVMKSVQSWVSSVFACAYSTNDFAAVADGGTVGIDTSGIVPTAVDRLNILSSSAAGITCGHIARLVYFPKRLPNNLLQFISKPA